MDSILTSIKKLLLIDEDDTSFDIDVIMHINSIIGILYDLGIETADNYVLIDSSQTWSDLLGDFPYKGMVELFVYLKVKPLFDSSTMGKDTIESFNREANELEWRILSKSNALRRDSTLN